MSDVLKGTLMYWFDDEAGHMLWLFLESGLDGLDGAHIIEDGDRLIVFDEEDNVVFNGYVDTDCAPDNSCSGGCGSCNKRALGFKVPWVQRGWDPHDWARLFVRYHKEGELPLQAELAKRMVH